MKIVNDRIKLSTKGAGDLLDITRAVAQKVEQSKLQTGNVTVFVVGSTAGITTFEYEPGLIRDMREFYDNMAPADRQYHHDETWGDANGFSHIRATFTGPSLTLLSCWKAVMSFQNASMCLFSQL